MKKLLYITILSLSLSGIAYADFEEMADFIEPNNHEVETAEKETFFKPIVKKEEKRENIGADLLYSFEYEEKPYSDLEEGDVPLFKRCRLFLRNKMLRYQQQSDINPVETDDDESYLDDETPKAVVKKKSFLDRFKRKKGSRQQLQDGQILNSGEGVISDSIQSETFQNISKETMSLESGISKHVTEKELTLDAENVTYDEDTGDMVATGRPSLFLPPQKTRVIADKMTYNQDSNILKAMGNVVMIRDGVPTKSDYVEVDMNEETIIADNVSSNANTVIMDAEKAIQKDDILTMTNGTLHSDVSEIYRMSSRMIGPKFSHLIVDEDDQALFFGDPTGNQIHLNIDNIRVEARKNHDMFVAKKIEVLRKGRHWFTWPSLTAYTNKERNYVEANYPEFGTKRKLGMFAGPGFAFGGPGGSVIKLIPFINYQHNKWGIGGAVKYRNKFNYTEFGYGSSADIFFLRGYQRLDDNLHLQYAANSFVNEWFLGSRMPKYMAELYYDKAHQIRDFLGDDKHLTFRHRIGMGIMEDNDRNYYGEKFNGSGMSTTRFRYMAQISQNLYSYENPEHRFYFNLGLSMQGSAAVYGTGDTQFVARIGPVARLQYKNWLQEFGYTQSGYDDHTPMRRYDAYRYGRSSVFLSEVLRINKYLSVGWSGTVNLSNDSPNGKMFQENRFGVALGPDDLKLRFGYDFVRKTTYFGFDVAFDTKGTNVAYKKLEIKNPERLGKNDKAEERKLAFTPVKPAQDRNNEKNVLFNKSSKPSKPQVLRYAQVINIEDPDKETVD